MSFLTASLTTLLLGLQGAQPEVRDADSGSSVLTALLPASPPAKRRVAFADVAASGDRRFLAPLVDLLRFAEPREEWFAVLDAFGALVGEDLRALERPWYHLTLRLAEDATLPFFASYAGWKGELLSQLVDPRMSAFLFEGMASRVRLDEVVWGGVTVDGIPSLDDPRTLAATEADAGGWEAQDPVFGLVLGGEARAYPLRILDWHEMVNDVVGGVPVALSYCTLCGAAVAYRSVLEDERLSFGSSGLLMRSNKLMYDRGTNSLWNQLTGEPVIGSLASSGATLEVLPVVATTWGAWKAEHPDSRILDLETGVARDYSLGASYGAYFGGNRQMFPAFGSVQGSARPSASLRSTRDLGDAGDAGDGNGAGGAAKDQVFVIRDGATVAAFARDELERRGVWNVQTADGGRYVLVTGRERSRPVLPRALASLLADRSERGDQDFGDPAPVPMARLGVADLVRLFEAAPDELTKLSDEALLALAPHVRRGFADELARRVPDALLCRRLLGPLAVRALAFEVRAYARGTREFHRAEVPAEATSGGPLDRLGNGLGDRLGDALVDQEGRRWRRVAEALVAEDGERLPRVPGHLAFRFGFEAFLADGSVAHDR